MITLTNFDIRTLAFVMDLYIAQIKTDKETCANCQEISMKLHEILKENKELIK